MPGGARESSCLILSETTIPKGDPQTGTSFLATLARLPYGKLAAQACASPPFSFRLDNLGTGM